MDYQSLPIVDHQLFEWMRTIRRTLHRQPELSFQEFHTSSLIQDKLDELGIDYQTGWAGTGVIAGLGAEGVPGGHVGLRADMDGLPIQDTKKAPYASTVTGVSHACGHDGHVAMLLGAAALLKRYRLPGRVSLIFQPAEEHGNGAEKIINQGALAGGISAIFGGHLDVHYPTGAITVDEGIICSAADPFSLHIVGRGGHAARPQEASDPIVAGAYLVTALQTLVSRETDPNKSAVVTIGCFQAGHANNAIAEDALIEGTIRTNDQEVRNRVVGGLQRICDGVALQFGLRIDVRFHDSLPVVINSAETAKVARRAAQLVVGQGMVISQGRPSLGGEDFAFYQQVIDGCLVRFGANSPPGCGPAHSGNFDFDENVLAVGASWLAAVAVQWLMEKNDQAAEKGLPGQAMLNEGDAGA